MTSLSFFGPKKYVRTTGAKDVYTAIVEIPAWLKAPFRLVVQNGEADGTFRVSSATVAINGTELLKESDFKQNAASYERAVTLPTAPQPKTLNLEVTLASKPTSYLTMWLYGAPAESTAPVLTWVRPPNGSAVNTATPELVVRYDDLLGANEPAASGVDLASLRVSIDDVDVSERFTRRSDEASGNIAAETPLAEGLHTYKASIADRAGNRAEVTGQFRVDLTNPVIAFTAPDAGAYLPTRTPGVTVAYSDDVALDVASLAVQVNGVAVPAARITATAAGATIDPGTLDEGPNQLTATIRDAGGNSASASVSFSVDVTDPAVAIAQPQPGARIGSRDVAVTLTWSDAQGIVPASGTATIDGNAATLAATGDGATAQLTALADGEHTFSATVADRAGNTGTASVTFIVDTTVPAIAVVAPPAGANINDNTPAVELQYADNEGVLTDSLKVTVNTADATSLFTKTPASATGQITTALPEGTTTVTAEIKDTTGNTGATESSFLVDTIAPTGTIEAPAARVKSATPLVTVAYADGGSGIDPASVVLEVDGAIVADVLAAGPEFASGALTTPLTDGTHTIEVTFADRAGNPATPLTATFRVDTVPPQLAIAVPANGTFVNTATPPLRVTYSDPGGTGADPWTVRLFLQQGSGPMADITAYVTRTPVEATGIVPATAPLADGTYLLRAVGKDYALNESTATSRFEVDTAPPLVEVESPVANGYVASATPELTLRWSDALSGVDTASVRVFIDGVDRTARFTMTPAGATGTLQASEQLAEGQHTIRVTAFDLAGNAAAEVEQTFTVDTIVPTVALENPAHGGYVGPAPYHFVATFDDGEGSGIAPAWVTVTIDGTDRTSAFTITPEGAIADIATALADGPHTIVVSILDWAGNAATATATFKADAVKPAVAITSPAAGAWLSGATVIVTGTVADASPVTLEVNGVMTQVTDGAFSVTIPTEEGSYRIQAVAVDAAANSGEAEVIVKVDSLAPVINVVEPVAGLVTKQSSFALSGNVEDTSTVTLTLDGQPLTLASNAFTTTVPLTADGVKSVTLTAVDQANNSSTKTVEVTRDSVAPQVSVLSPASGAVIGTLPVVVSGTFTDATATTVTVDGVSATITGESWQASISGLDEGAHAFAVVATDAAGNVTTVSHEVTIDLVAPVISITTPTSGTLTKLATTTVTGTVSDTTLTSVKVGELTATLTPGTTPDEKSFTVADVPLAEGDNTLQAIAADALARTTSAAVLVTRDSIPPVVTVDAPQLITRTRPAHVSALVDDNLALRDVVFSLEGAAIATQTTAPFGVDVIAPQTAEPGDVLVLTVVATDTVGNATTVTKDLRVTSDGAVTGLVLSNATGLPIAGARVRIAGDAQRQATTDAKGRYALPANDQNLVLTIEAPSSAGAMTTAERTVAIASGVGTVPVDARLTPLGAKVNIGTSGGTLTAGDVTVTIPGGAVSSQTGMRLTLTGTQGPPNLLPLGWKPAVSFDVRADGTVAAVPFSLAVANAPATAHLVRYDTTLHAWTVVTPSVAAAAGVIRTNLPEPGAYALVVADGANVPAPVAGELLGGVAMQPIPDTATSSGNVNPPTLPPTGGAATGTLTVHAPEPLPSGTVVQAEVTETFSLASGEVASEEKRTQDLVLFRDGDDVTAQFPIVPSRSFTTGELLEGRVHLDILAGRESVRGRTGGSQALTLNAGDAIVTIPAGSLPEDLAISATPAVLSAFLPSTPAATPIAELVLDFGGITLGTSAVVSVKALNASATETAVVARVERVGGIPKVVVVAGAELEDGRWVSKDLGSLPGIRRDGRYVFYRLTTPWSLVDGSVALPSASSSAVVTIEGFPFVAIATGAGDFTTIAPAGTVRFTASVPNTSLSGETTAQIVPGQTGVANISLVARATTATVTPADGTLRVPVSTQIEITADAPLRATSASSGTVVLRKASNGAGVALRFVFSGSGRVLAAVPQALLEAGETYTLTVSGLADIYGGSVVLAPVTFTTAPDEPPQYDTQRVVFTMPGPDGNVTVSAPPGSLPPGTRVMIVNTGNGVVVSFTVGNDGSFTGTFPATINDSLSVTITDPLGNIVTFTRSQFVATDGSGRTAVGPGGGIVQGPGGVELRIPEGALESGAVFKVEAIGPNAFPERPDDPNAHWGGGLKITSEQKPKLKKEADLVFPRPADAPAGSFYYVYRRLTGPDGKVAFQTIDHAFEDGNGKVVTASYPFVGWKDSVVAWQAKADFGGLAMGIGAEVIFSMMYTWDAMMPGLPIPGVVAGFVYRPVWDAGATEPRYEPVEGALVLTVRENGVDVPVPTVAVTEADGHFSLWDSHYTGGTVDVEAYLGDDFARATAFQANVSNTRANNFGNLVNTYGYAAEVNLTFPATTAPPRAPDVEVKVMTLDQSQDLLRREIEGVVAAETPLLIGFNFRDDVEGQITGASVNGEELSVRADDGTPGTGERFDYILSSLYTPRHAGTYVVKATVLNPFTGAPTYAEHTFLVVAGGGTNNAGIPNAAPDWITRKLVPKENALGVSVDVLPQVVFTEPVTHVMDGLQLSSSTGDVAYTVSAVGLTEQGSPRVIQDLRLEPAETRITSITILPRGGLSFATTYNLRLTSAIKDTDVDAAGQPAPRSFPDRTLTFTTIKPEHLGDSADVFFSPAVAVIGDYAYVGKQGTGNGWLGVYDIADPESISEVGRYGVLGMPTHLTAAEKSPVNEDQDVVAIGSGLKFTPPGPSNVYLFDVRSPAAPKRIAIVSVAESAEAGVVLRLALRGKFLYTVTFPYGIQVIDLEKATQLYKDADADPYRRYRMALDSVVAGKGFGQSAVVNSVNVLDPNTGYRAHLLDIEAEQYLVNGSTRTLVIGTGGGTPFVVLDPTETSPRVTSVPLSGPGKLEFGRALKLTRVNNQNLVLVVGTGSAKTETGAMATGTGLFIFDMAEPFSPKLIGSRIVDPAGSDVTISGTTVVITNGSTGTTYNISDPTNPRYLGTVPNVGYRMAIGGEGGFVVSTGQTTSAGLHVSSLKPVVIVKKGDPVKITLTGNGTVDTPQKVDGIEALNVNIKVIPVVSGLSGDVHVINKHFPGSNGADGGITPYDYPIVWTNPAKGEGRFTIPAGDRYEDSDLVAQATVNTDNGQLVSAPRSIKLGWVRLDLDSNNNSDIDGLDREAARKGRAFGFWEADPFYDLKRVNGVRNPPEGATVGNPPEEGEDEKGLADYFTVRITVNKLWRPGTGTAAVRLKFDRPGVDWTIAHKLAAGKDYLRNETKAKEQIAEIVAGKTDPNDIPVCAATQTRIHGEGLGECRPGENGAVTLPPLAVGTYEFLVRCRDCKNRTQTAASFKNPPKMILELVPDESATSGARIDETRADIRPVRQWITYASIRPRDVRNWKPLSYADVYPRYESFYARDPHEPATADQRKWANEADGYKQWATAVAEEARDITVLVHGYKVTDSAMRNVFLPSVFKRLYWVGHPVHRLQGEWRQEDELDGCVKDCAHTVGISWPSNLYGYEPGYVTGWLSGTRETVADKIAGISFPKDEYLAFATGPAMAKYLAEMRRQNPQRRINVMAHSLGNLAVHSALSRPEMINPKAVDRFIMNEAAMPAEAVAPVPADPSFLTLWGERHQEIYGYPNDAPWLDDYDNVMGLILKGFWKLGLKRLRDQVETADESQKLRFTDEREFYVQRWRMTRSPYGVPNHQPEVLPTRGPWRGMFADNKNRTRLFNTFSGHDRILTVVWRSNQLENKPLYLQKRLALEKPLRLLGINTRERDNAGLQYWLMSNGTEPHYDTVFGGEAPGQYWTIKRQWAELSYWFPSTATAAGAMKLDQYFNTTCGGAPCKTDFTEYSGYTGPAPVESIDGVIDAITSAGQSLTHGYMAYRPLTKVFPAFEEVRKMLDPEK